MIKKELGAPKVANAMSTEQANEPMCSKSKSGREVKRKAIDVGKKLEIVRRKERGETLSGIARTLGLSKSTVCSILKDRDRIVAVGGNSGGLKIKYIKQGPIHEMEKLLTVWIADQVKKQISLNLKIIQAKACNLFEEIKQNNGGASVQSFNASNGWFNRFKRRANLENVLLKGETTTADLNTAETHKVNREKLMTENNYLSLKSIQAEDSSLFEFIKEKNESDCDQCSNTSNGRFSVCKEVNNADSNAAEAFKENLKKLMTEEKYLPEQVFNVIETVLFWKKMPEKTYVCKETMSMLGFKADKDRLTLLVGGNAVGYKLKPFLVYHTENPKAFKGFCKGSLPVHFRANKKGCVTQTLFDDWFINCFSSEVNVYCLRNGIPFKILLILDSAPNRAHYLNDLNPNIKVIFFPPHTTSILQPMEQGVIATLKMSYICNTFAKAIDVIENSHQIIIDIWKGYNILHAIGNIDAAWEEVSEQCMRSIWNNLNVSKEYEKDKEMAEILKNIVVLGEEFHLELNSEDIIKVIDYVGDNLTNEDLMELEAERIVEEKRSKEDGDGEKVFVMDDMCAAFSKINEGLSMFKKMDSNFSRYNKVENVIQRALYAYRDVYKAKQKQDIAMNKKKMQ